MLWQNKSELVAPAIIVSITYSIYILQSEHSDSDTAPQAEQS